MWKHTFTVCNWSRWPWFSCRYCCSSGLRRLWTRASSSLCEYTACTTASIKKKYVSVKRSSWIYRNQTDYYNCFIYLCWNTHLVDNKYYFVMTNQSWHVTLFSIVSTVWVSSVLGVFSTQKNRDIRHYGTWFVQLLLTLVQFSTQIFQTLQNVCTYNEGVHITE
jgi:hypothetical protein